MRIGFVQFAPRLGEVDRNFEAMERLVSGARADLLVFPELANSGYAIPSKESADEWAATLQGPQVEKLVQISRRVRGWIVVGMLEKSGSNYFNSSFLVGPAGVKSVYRKSHLFGTERDVFEPGNTGFHSFHVGEAKVGMMVCFDWAFPESAGTLARRGAQIVAHPANLVLPHAKRAMPIRALENRVFTVTANRYGEDTTPSGVLKFNGESMIVSPKGEILAKAPLAQDDVQIIDVNPKESDDKYLTPTNHLVTDRRPQLYG